MIVISYLGLMPYPGCRGMRMSRTSDYYLVAGCQLDLGMYIPCVAAVIPGGVAAVGVA